MRSFESEVDQIAQSMARVKLWKKDPNMGWVELDEATLETYKSFREAARKRLLEWYS